MPKKYPAYPYVEPVAIGLSAAEIETTIKDLFSQNPGVSIKDGGPLDPLCRALQVDLEYSAPPNEILLDVPVGKKAVIWLAKQGKPRHDRMAVGIGLGFWLMHVPRMRESHPKNGIQALYTPTDRLAWAEAVNFAYALLMPTSSFLPLWYEGKAQLTADVLNVPTQAVYDRAKGLMLTQGDDKAEAG